jgi:GNAT superfamily N-acetyltransferase
MRWDWKLEENPHADLTLEEFLRECEAFLRRGIEAGDWAHWIATEDGALLSNASVFRVPKIPHPRRKSKWLGYVTNVCTVPDRRRQGIGASLMAHLVEWAKAGECDTLILWPSLGSVPFYERAGFRNDNDILEHTLE